MKTVGNYHTEVFPSLSSTSHKKNIWTYILPFKASCFSHWLFVPLRNPILDIDNNNIFQLKWDLTADKFYMCIRMYTYKRDTYIQQQKIIN